jgi:hypothetical protein
MDRIVTKTPQELAQEMAQTAGVRLNEIVVASVRRVFEEDSRHLIVGYLNHISSTEKVAG